MKYDNHKGKLAPRRKLSLRQRIVKKRVSAPYGVELHSGLKRVGR